MLWPLMKICSDLMSYDLISKGFVICDLENASSLTYEIIILLGIFPEKIFASLNDLIPDFSEIGGI